MFDKNIFKKQLEILMDGMNTVEFSEKTSFNRTYLSKYLNLKLDRPPSPELLKAISGEKISYTDLMISCGYIDAKETSLEDTVKIPVIGVVHAGTPILAVENIEDYEYVNRKDILPSYDYFYLRVQGNSMINARIYDGDLVFVRKQSDVENGDIAVVMTNQDEVSIKRIIKKGNIIVLQPENPDYMPMIFDEQDCEKVKILGKVEHVKFKI
ncbi:MAG: repressor LexA [Tyzzerella sp.]|uniref:Repressor LexA n=1 Tax=Candidatus Fimicola merdigallinarum TaxID=2840819 RepID=A0A9D9DUK6_9FIRM|nr:repressor LexA [Candidatus Fimicola merdigallinarum]